MTHAYDRNGQPMSMAEFGLRITDIAYKHVGVTAIDDETEVSTVWMGLDHNFFGEGPPLIFETMIFGGPLDGQRWRWPTEEAAIAGHDQVVELCREEVST